MKNLYRYLFITALIWVFVSCSDDALSASEIANPLNKNVITIETTVSSTVTVTGEGNLLPVSVALGQTFDSDATITVQALLTNGNSTTGTVKIVAGQTSGEGSVILPADDGDVPITLISEGVLSVKATAILLESLVPNTSYVLESNNLKLDVYADTAPSDGGLNYIFDWTDASNIDIDIQIIDAAFTSIFESSGSATRFESDLFQNSGRSDGTYVVYARIYSNISDIVSYNLLFTKQDNTLIALQGTFDNTAPTGGARIPIAEFTKKTDAVTGEIDYVNIMAR